MGKKTRERPRGVSKRAAENERLKPDSPLELKEAVEALKKFKMTKFDQAVEVCMTLGVNPKQADQLIRGSVALPMGVGKSKRVIAFCDSTKAKTALEAGAIKAGAEELIEEVMKGWMDFDVAVASPDMMRQVSKLGRTLGPKGLMPTPKAGTVTPNVAQAVKEYAAGKVEYRNDKGGNVHAAVGKMSFSVEDLVANLNHFITTIEKARPTSTKGRYIKKITLSGSMTPGVEVAYAGE